MRAAPGLRIGISQRLTMTPQLLESVRLLQHAGADLNRYVDEQLASNPLLDRAEPEHRDPKAAALDSWSDTGVVWARPSGGHASFTDELEAEQPDLRAHLAEQANVDLPPDDRVTAELLIDLVDANGYLAGFDPLEVAELSRTTVADVLRVLEQLQTFDPPGACARSLAECLRLQLVFRESDSPKMLLLLDHLDLVGEGAEDKLCALLGVSIEDLRALLAELRSLNPRPGLAFAGRREFLGAPDIVATPSTDGWRIELNPACFPRIYADRAGYLVAREHPSAASDDGSLARQWQEAAWLVRALRQRAQSVYRVASVLVRIQDDYVRHGASHRRPLALRTVAGLVDLHESTVSRVVANKTMATPRGTIPLRSFFDRRLGSAEGGTAPSPTAGPARIQALIDAERPDRPPMSDQQIVGALEATGVQVARRTVAKYRRMMRIPSSTRRRQLRRSPTSRARRARASAP
ncbi:MAG: RNA polymerase factor sigma-54 [Rhodospirillales bacterium]|nr:RNA polymerase factor sigma-54 [Rhodospirillales bacterium]